MLRRLAPYLGLGILLVLLAAWWAAPRLMSVFPQQGDVPTGAVPIRLTFTRPVQLDSVTTHVRFTPNVPGTWQVQDTQAIFTPKEPWEPGQTVTAEVLVGLKGANGLPLLSGKKWQFTVAPVMLAYLWPADNPDIYARDLTTNRTQRLTSTGGVRGYAVSRDGRFVYFSAFNGLGTDILRVDRLTIRDEAVPKAERLLACQNDQCLNPQPSPDGHWLAYERSDGPGGASRVHILALADSQENPIIPASHVTYGPLWSSEGLLAYYDATRRGYVVVNPRDGNEVAFFANDTGESAAWSPDGHDLVAVALLLEGGAAATPAPSQAPYLAAHLWRYRLGSHVQPADLTKNPNLEDATPSFSPNGEWLAFGRKALDPKHWTPGRQLWLMHPDGTAAFQVTHAANYNHLDFAWHPDATWLAYARTNQVDLTQPPEVWLYNLQSGKSTLAASNAIMPRWLP